MRVGVITFPGTLDDRDAARAVVAGGAEAVSLWHGDADLKSVDAVVLPGGFSYGDYLRCGAISRFAPVMELVIDAANKGMPVLGICNGFQILCESGLLPGVLLQNANQQFICKNVFIKSENSDPLQIPIAHGEGRYFADEATLASLEQNNQIIFRYCDANGKIGGDANPNGAIKDIAGICNANRNVFGMMPHPERATNPALNNTDGVQVFELLGLLKTAAAI